MKLLKIATIGLILVLGLNANAQTENSKSEIEKLRKLQKL